jgi:putative N-acetyltransferase (TIGR04045 family)
MSVTGLRTEVVCAPVCTPEQLADHHRIRHAVFVQEQGIFAESDVDAHDAADGVVHVLATVGDESVGTVRLFPVAGERGLWQGDRLAVLDGWRTFGVGAPLVRFAVRYAGEHGGTRMIAHIQTPNVVFFRRLGWSVCGEPEQYVGVTHQPMDIALTSS